MNLLYTLDRSMILLLQRRGLTVTATSTTGTDAQLVRSLGRWLMIELGRRGQRV